MQFKKSRTKLVYLESELLKVRAECAKVRRLLSDNVAKVCRTKDGVKVSLQVALGSAKGAILRVSNKVPTRLQQTWKRMTLQLMIKAAMFLANVQASIARDINDISCDLARCKALEDIFPKSVEMSGTGLVLSRIGRHTQVLRRVFQKTEIMDQMDLSASESRSIP